MILTDTIKRYAIAAAIVVFVMLIVATGILYKRTVELRDDKNELTTQITALTLANDSLQLEITKRKSVDQLTNKLSSQLSQIINTIDQSSHKTQLEVRNALKNQPCATTELPYDLRRLLTNSDTD